MTNISFKKKKREKLRKNGFTLLLTDSIQYLSAFSFTFLQNLPIQSDSLNIY